MGASLDVSIVQCPHCRAHYAEASWYAVELASDLECRCGKTFNPVNNLRDRILVEFFLDDKGKVKTVGMSNLG
jgi:hypothetical protein